MDKKLDMKPGQTKEKHLQKQCIEAILLVLSNSAYFEDYVVRGSVSSQSWMGPYKRAFHDLDLLYLPGTDLDVIGKQFVSLLGEVKNYCIDVSVDEIVFHDLWKDSISPGVRLAVPFSINGECSELQVDIAVGDPLVKPPTSTKFSSMHYGVFPIKTVVLEIAIAWKLHGLFEQLNGPWLSKTLWDTFIFCKFNAVNQQILLEAINEAFTSRLDPVEITKRLLFGDFAQSKRSRKKWDIELQSIVGENVVPLEEVLDFLRDYFKPILNLKDDGTLLTQAEVITYRINKLRYLKCENSKKKLKTLATKICVLPYKAYKSIPHMKDSRLGASERCIDNSKHDMLTMEKRHSEDRIIIQEKLDGSCVCAYRRKDEILALGRDGDLAYLSPNESRRMWADWVDENAQRFMTLLKPGERAVGEWLAMAHGTRYELRHEPFVLFDIFNSDNQELDYESMIYRASDQNFTTPKLIHCGEPCGVDEALSMLGCGFHGAIGSPEGIVWRLERNGLVQFKAKYVRPDKVDGELLTEVTGQPIIWNWKPEK